MIILFTYHKLFHQAIRKSKALILLQQKRKINRLSNLNKNLKSLKKNSKLRKQNNLLKKHWKNLLLYLKKNLFKRRVSQQNRFL